MVQELHVLQCFSCETFQSHIVKKTNKWECKICGTKQSIKKVYGRGSGKDCRLHTQKLNALKGEKESSKHVWTSDEETEEHIPDSLESNKCSDFKIHQDLPKVSKWSIYVNDEETDVKKSFPVQEISKPNFIQRKKIKGINSKRKFCFLESDFTDLHSDFKNVEEMYSSIENSSPNFSLLDSPKDFKKVNCATSYGNTVTDCHSNNANPTVEISEENESENENLGYNLKVKKQGFNYMQPKMNNKWLKYLDERSAEEEKFCSQSSAHDPPCISFTGESGDVPVTEKNMNSGKCSSFNFSNFGNKASLYDDDRRKFSPYEYCYSRIKNQDNSDNILEPADKMICSNEAVEKQHERPKGKEESGLQTFPCRPVFEQNCDLDDSDYQLDF